MIHTAARGTTLSGVLCYLALVQAVHLRVGAKGDDGVFALAQESHATREVVGAIEAKGSRVF